LIDAGRRLALSPVFCDASYRSLVVLLSLQVGQEGFERNGVGIEIDNGNRHAELHLLRAGKEVASAEYHLREKDGFSVIKWAGASPKWIRLLLIFLAIDRHLCVLCFGRQKQIIEKGL
jgi:hypothetical protein